MAAPGSAVPGRAVPGLMVPGRPVTPAAPAAAGTAALWNARQFAPRWRALMAVFEPISALSPEDVNVLWTSDLYGTAVDPTTAGAGNTPLAVKFAFPASSGDPRHPAQPATWYAGTWLAGGTGKGWIAQCPVGPGSTGPTLTAGQSYDVWSQILNAGSESPVKFAGVQAVY